MKMNDIEKRLYHELENLEIIDAHEHLGPESARIAAEVDVFTFFAHYTRGDLLVAGMPEDVYKKLFDRSVPLDERWRLFAPYWEQIRYGSYAKAALIAAKRFYDVEDINENTYIPLTEKIQKANTPGIYERVLRDACKIRTALTQCGSTDLGGTPLLTPVMPLIYSMETGTDLMQPKFAPDAKINSLDDFLDAMKAYVMRVKKEGAVGLKMMSNPYQSPSKDAASTAFNDIKTGNQKTLPLPNPLRDYVVDEVIRFAAEQHMVICVHTGYWGDFRMLDPTHMIPILQRHPKARFDIYHLGYPWMREAIMLGKGFPNVWLNLCWTHIISQKFVQIAVDELIDLIPVNKVIGFGGDYGLPVEKVYGHLVMARQDFARVFARRIADGDLTENQALAILKNWLWDNPKELYDLRLQ
ncbi:MAG TPA: amidohydrolase family protein [Candidatus Hydrogenedentes bacterium]|nr:amidohydrolase family protein [Candidatus Hydrogenedentota bacterium]HOL77259.1 amidohydrolase family protein [Candidatus Hydrogenedentota bacterium]HPO86549.1 amidohydrolase family protein [Candidatus Hydrogenedentota bacterium]